MRQGNTILPREEIVRKKMVLDQGKKKYPNPTTIAESLVADGADHNDANQDGLTCLMYAARNGNLETICSGCQTSTLTIATRLGVTLPRTRTRTSVVGADVWKWNADCKA